MKRNFHYFKSTEDFNRIVLAARGGDSAPALAVNHPSYGTSNSRNDSYRLPNAAQTRSERYALSVWASCEVRDA